jgi:hypothetical protein
MRSLNISAPRGSVKLQAQVAGDQEGPGSREAERLDDSRWAVRGDGGPASMIASAREAPEGRFAAALRLHGIRTPSCFTATKMQWNGPGGEATGSEYFLSSRGALAFDGVSPIPNQTLTPCGVRLWRASGQIEQNYRRARASIRGVHRDCALVGSSPGRPAQQPAPRHGSNGIEDPIEANAAGESFQESEMTTSLPSVRGRRAARGARSTPWRR